MELPHPFLPQQALMLTRTKRRVFPWLYTLHFGTVASLLSLYPKIYIHVKLKKKKKGSTANFNFIGFL